MAKDTFSNLIQSEIPMLIDFYAEWCGPCKTFLPVLDQIKQELGQQVRIIKIDVDKNLKLAQKMEIMGVPTVMIYHRGTLIWEAPGVPTKQFLLAKLRALLSTSN